jgi:hypothetical protein
MTLCTQQAAAAAVLVYLCSALLALQSLVSSRGDGEGEGEGEGEEEKERKREPDGARLRSSDRREKGSLAGTLGRVPALAGRSRVGHYKKRRGEEFEGGKRASSPRTGRRRAPR